MVQVIGLMIAAYIVLRSIEILCFPPSRYGSLYGVVKLLAVLVLLAVCGLTVVLLSSGLGAGL